MSLARRDRELTVILRDPVYRIQEVRADVIADDAVQVFEDDCWLLARAPSKDIER